jgi:hypothetical protein
MTMSPDEQRISQVLGDKSHRPIVGISLNKPGVAFAVMGKEDASRAAWVGSHVVISVQDEDYEFHGHSVETRFGTVRQVAPWTPISPDFLLDGSYHTHSWSVQDQETLEHLRTM